MHPAYVARFHQAKTRANSAKTKELASIWCYIANVLQELAERRERLEMDCESYRRLYAQLMEQTRPAAQDQSKPLAPL